MHRRKHLLFCFPIIIDEKPQTLITYKILCYTHAQPHSSHVFFLFNKGEKRMKLCYENRFSLELLIIMQSFEINNITLLRCNHHLLLALIMEKHL